jgi:hypothetical protein
VPARVLHDDEQLEVRVDPTEEDAAPRHSSHPAEESDDAQPAAAAPSL